MPESHKLYTHQPFLCFKFLFFFPPLRSSLGYLNSQILAYGKNLLVKRAGGLLIFGLCNIHSAQSQKKKKSELKQGAKGSRGLRVCNQPQTMVVYNWKYHKLFWLARRIVYIHTHGYINWDFWIIASSFQRVNYKSDNAICLNKTSCPGIWKPAGAGGIQSLRGRFQISEFLSARKIHNPGKERPKGLENMHGIINVREQANRFLAFW